MRATRFIIPQLSRRGGSPGVSSWPVVKRVFSNAVGSSAVDAAATSAVLTTPPTAADGSPSPQGPTQPKQLSLAQRLAVYSELSKFRLSSLVVVTTGAGFLATGLPIDWAVLAATCVGTGFCAASANTFNQVYEREYDVKMNRTKNRPLPKGVIKVPEAVGWGVTAGAVGTGMLLASSNPVVAALGAGNIFLYAGPYTYLKQRSEINTWVGSLVGAIPPLMGWAAATGGEVLASDPLFLAGILFLWQFPHFFALSWMHREDYARGGFQMVAVNDPQATRSGELTWRYSLYLTAVPIAAYGLDLTSSMFALEGSAVNMYLLYLAHKFKQNQSNANARRVFLCSLWYLPLLLGSFVFYSKRWEKDGEEDKKSQLTDYVTTARDWLRGKCVHEILVHQQHDTASSGGASGASSSSSSSSSSDSDNGSGSGSIAPNFCPKILADKASAVSVSLPANGNQESK